MNVRTMPIYTVMETAMHAMLIACHVHRQNVLNANQTTISTLTTSIVMHVELAVLPSVTVITPVTLVLITIINIQPMDTAMHVQVTALAVTRRTPAINVKKDFICIQMASLVLVVLLTAWNALQIKLLNVQNVNQAFGRYSMENAILVHQTVPLNVRILVTVTAV